MAGVQPIELVFAVQYTPGKRDSLPSSWNGKSQGAPYAPDEVGAQTPVGVRYCAALSLWSQGTLGFAQGPASATLPDPVRSSQYVPEISAGSQLPLTSNPYAALPLREAPAATSDEESLLSYLSDKALHIDEITRDRKSTRLNSSHQ